MAASKRLPPEQERRVRTLLDLVIARHFTVQGRPMSENSIAPKIGLTQSVLNSIRAGRGGAGLAALVAIRNYTGLTLDEILGLPPVDTVKAPLSPGEREALRVFLLEALDGLEKRVQAKLDRLSRGTAGKAPRKGS